MKRFHQYTNLSSSLYHYPLYQHALPERGTKSGPHLGQVRSGTLRTPKVVTHLGWSSGTLRTPNVLPRLGLLHDLFVDFGTKFVLN